MHAATFLAANRWRFAGLARTGLGPAAWAGKHRPGVALVVGRHFLRRLRKTGAGLRSLLLSMVGIGLAFASVSAGGDATDSLVRPPCETLPTMAWPPS